MCPLNYKIALLNYYAYIGNRSKYFLPIYLDDIFCEDFRGVACSNGGVPDIEFTAPSTRQISHYDPKCEDTQLAAVAALDIVGGVVTRLGLEDAAGRRVGEGRRGRCSCSEHRRKSFASHPLVVFLCLHSSRKYPVALAS